MSKKIPTWTRRRVGRTKVYWVAYDDQPGTEDRKVVSQGYEPDMVKADAAARLALSEAGLYQARRTSGAASARKQVARPSEPGQGRPRRYLYTRRHGNPEGDVHIRAHLITKSTPRKIYVTERSCWTAQIGTEDEEWGPSERTIALDRARLDQDGSVTSTRLRDSSFYRSLDEATGDLTLPERRAFQLLGLGSPCTREDLKVAYRQKALDVHPDRGGADGAFQAVEDAYRRLLRAAGEPD
ncbi:J domain-containing protein [Tundrisphaera lichenicola]|uniref:J domain-containing protein n=1 Tax=Tundrisphaera lichenicola TaxID=2029860 RepID=UPI003EBE3D27